MQLVNHQIPPDSYSIYWLHICPFVYCFTILYLTFLVAFNVDVNASMSMWFYEFVLFQICFSCLLVWIPLTLHVGNRNIMKMIEMALEGNTMLYRHSPITINENHTKIACQLLLFTCYKQNTAFRSRTYGVNGTQTCISDALSLRLRASEMSIFVPITSICTASSWCIFNILCSWPS